jgi:hypothetical protein
MKGIPIQYPLDKGIPVPVKRSPQNLVPVSDMDAGDSILFPEKMRATVQSRASRVKARTGRLFTIRKVEEGFCRIWRTK